MKKKILSGILIITMMATCVFAGVACSNEKGQNEQLNIGIEHTYTNSNIQFDESANNGINLMSEVIPTNAYATYGVSEQAEVAYTLTATVNPSSATNKAVDWSIAWMDPTSIFAIGKTVTDYVTVVPSYDGSTIATVTCYQAFEGEILVTVTTREGGFQADCIVTFSGIPTSIEISSSTLSPISADTYGLGVGVTYDFDINMDNVFGVVGEKYYDYSIGFQAMGTLTVGTLEDDPRGSPVWYSTRTANLSEFAEQIISYSIEGDVLHVTFNKSVEGFYSSMVRNGAVKTYYDRVQSIDSPCSFILQISTKELGVSFNKKVTFVIDSSVVTGVSVKSALEF